VLYLQLQGEVPDLETGVAWNQQNISPALKRLIDSASGWVADGH